MFWDGSTYDKTSNAKNLPKSTDSFPTTDSSSGFNTY